MLLCFNVPGTTFELDNRGTEAELIRLCADLKLRDVDGVVRSNDGSAFPSIVDSSVGFAEIDSLRTEFPPPTSRFMASPKRM